MKFVYMLNGIGWADVTLQINNSTIKMSPSYLSEPLIDLIDIILLLVDEENDNNRDEYVIEWNEEPCIDKWIISRLRNDSIRIKIDVFPNGEAGSGYTKFDESCLLMDFVKEIVSTMENLLISHGLVGYKKTWYAKDFPVCSYLILRQLINPSEQIQVQEKANDIGIDMYISDLKGEIAILSKLTNDSI